MGVHHAKRAAQLILWVSVLSHASVAAAAPGRAEIDAALGRLAGEHDGSVAALYVLQSGGALAAAAIRDAWPSLSLLARKRVIGALRPLSRSHDAAVDALVEAARSHDEELQSLALAALRRHPDRGRAGLAALIDDPRVGDRAARALARTDPGFAIPALLAAMQREGGQDRPALRDALATAVQRDELPGRALARWLRGDPDPRAVASAALGLGLAGIQPATVTAFIEYASKTADDFSSRWRLLRSASAAGSSARIDGWIEEQRSASAEWMLRAAAVDAAAARGSRDRVRASLADEYPRVRMRAARALGGDAGSLIERATLARRDVWPMVRAAAVASLRDDDEALSVVVASVDDAMSVVRAAAIETLTPASHDEGWDRIHRRLRAANEWPAVTDAAIEYAVAHCRADAAESLFRIVMRASAPNALTDDLNSAARAIEALRALGTPEAIAVVERLRATPDVPPTLKMALDRPLRNDVGCQGPPS